MTQYDFVVVGGGFQGIVAATLIAKAGHKVALLEKAPFLGGVLHGGDYNGLVLDFGCHVFNNDKGPLTQIILEILNHKYLPIFVEYAAITEGHKKEELAVPDFSWWSEEKHEEVLAEMLANADQRLKTGDQFDNLQDWLHSMYGRDAGDIVGKIMRKASGQQDTSDLHQTAILRTPLSRMHLKDDVDGKLAELKASHSEFDKALALPSQKDEMRFYRDATSELEYRTYYPAENCMRGFGDSALTYLKSLGVDMIFGRYITSVENAEAGGVNLTLDDGETINAGQMVWTLDSGMLSNILWKENPMADYSIKVPMALFYFFVNKDVEPGYTYIHDFREDRIVYRTSCPGFYGKHYNDKNQSYIHVEVPSSTQSDVWKNPEKYYQKVWDELNDIGMVNLDKWEDVHSLSSPVSYPIQAANYEPAYRQISDKLNAEFPDIINVNVNAYSKNHMLEVITGKLQELKCAA